MQGFNVVDYADDETDLVNNNVIDNIIFKNSFFHLLITGWSEDSIDINTLNNSFDHSFELRPIVDKLVPNEKEGFHCLDLSLNYEDCSSVIENLKPILTGCLKCFNNYINVALAYKIKMETGDGEQVKIKLYYPKRETEKNLYQQVISFIREMAKIEPEKGAFKSKPFCDDILSLYLDYGIERESEQIKNKKVEKAAITILDKLRKEVNKININFEYPDGVLSEFSQVYYRPGYSFPLPIRLSFKKLCHEKIWNSKDWSQEKKTNNDKILNTPVLGYYTRDDEGGCKGPHIVLCPLDIKDAAAEAVQNNPNVDEILLYKIVLIHELAHARMDAKRNEDSMKSIFAHAMEESLANMLTLQCFKDYYDQSVLEHVKSFVNTQDDIYKFGINQFEAEVKWSRWCCSYKDMHDELEVWFKACFEDPKLTEPDAVRSAYDSVFNRTKNKRQSHKSIKK